MNEPTPLSTPAPRGAVVLIVSCLDDQGRVALLRAHALAMANGLPLRVLWMHAVDALPWHANDRRVLEWCRAALPYEPSPEQLHVFGGDVAAHCCLLARALHADCVVLAATAAAPDFAVILSRRLRIPVVVARPARPEGSVIGATSLRIAGFPIVRRVAELSARFEARPLLVHGVADGTGPEVEGKRALLREVASGLLPGAEVIIEPAETPADAILHAARRHDCDLIVVGLGPDRLIASVVEQVVLRAHRSVWVSPLASEPAGGWAA